MVSAILLKDYRKRSGRGQIRYGSVLFSAGTIGYLHRTCQSHSVKIMDSAQKYHGKFNTCFDDTNLTKERVEFVESIKADIKWLGADWEDRLFFIQLL